MPNTINRFTTWGDGEGVDYGDMNRLALWQMCFENDYKFAMLTRTDPTVAAPWLEADYTKKLHRHHNAGYLYAGASNRQVKNKRGLIAQWTAVPDSTEPKLLCYWLDDDEINLTCATADATNPRYDVVAVKLELEGVSETRDFEDSAGVLSSTTQQTYKRVKCTARIITGTPAVSPTRPALAAGEAYFATIKIPATFNAPLSLDPGGTNEFRDYSYPIGEIKRAYISGQQMEFNPADWTVGLGVGTTMMAITSAAISKVARAPLRHHAADEWKILKAEFNHGGSLNVSCGIAYSVSESLYAGGITYPAMTKDWCDLSAIDTYTHSFWWRMGAWSNNPAHAVMKYTTGGAEQVSYAVFYYK